MKHIVSASRRTDVPAFHSEWFIAALRKGYCEVNNPYNNIPYTVSLRPEDVSCIVFWTKNPQPLMPYLPEVDQLGIPYYFQFTLNGYSELAPSLEPGVPTLKASITTMQNLAQTIGGDKIIWRYDPIILSSLTPVNYHIDMFENIIAAIHPFVSRVVISLFDDYAVPLQRLTKVIGLGSLHSTAQITQDISKLVPELAQAAHRYGLGVYSCAENWEQYGVLPGACIDSEFIKLTFGVDIYHKIATGRRPLCHCVASKDIGSYNTCNHKCLYCYATT